MSATALSTRVLLANGGLPAKQVISPLPVYAALTPYIIPVISEQNTLSIAADVIGLVPMLPTIAEVWLPVFVIPAFDKIAKLFVAIEKRLTGDGPAASALVGRARLSKKETTNTMTVPINFIFNPFLNANPKFCFICTLEVFILILLLLYKFVIY